MVFKLILHMMEIFMLIMLTFLKDSLINLRNLIKVINDGRVFINFCRIKEIKISIIQITL